MRPTLVSKKVVEVAQHAERVAYEIFDSELHAVTLLYLGAMHAFRNWQGMIFATR